MNFDTFSNKKQTLNFISQEGIVCSTSRAADFFIFSNWPLWCPLVTFFAVLAFTATTQQQQFQLGGRAWERNFQFLVSQCCTLDTPSAFAYLLPKVHEIDTVSEETEKFNKNPSHLVSEFLSFNTFWRFMIFFSNIA